MKTPEQLKGAIRNIAVSKSLHPQEVLQMFLLNGFWSGCRCPPGMIILSRQGFIVFASHCNNLG